MYDARTQTKNRIFPIAADVRRSAINLIAHPFDMLDLDAVERSTFAVFFISGVIITAIVRPIASEMKVNASSILLTLPRMHRAVA
jgi:hypothetical protein